MRSIFFLIVSVLFIYTQSTAQVTNVVFLGSVSVNGGKAYTYKLYANDSDDVITGYSVMDLMGPDETKTYISGKINREKKQLTFRETHIWYTRSKENDTNFCYLHARLKAGKIQGANTLKGNFTGYKSNRKTECAKGKIMLVCAQDALDKLMEIAEKEKILPDTVKKTPKIRSEVMYDKEVEDENIMKLLPGKSLELDCPNAITVIEIWDSKNIDGDIITLMQGNKALLENYKISGTRKTIDIPMTDGRPVNLRLIAVNEGADPTNTARIKVVSGSETYFIDATTTMGKDVIIVLNPKPKS